MLGIVITYYSLAECCTKVDVLDVVQLSDWTADAIYQAMIGVLKENNVPLHNWVGFCADTTNVMMGLNNSVSQRVKENFPTVIIVKCSCHSIHLVSSYTCKKLPSSLEDLVRTIYVHLKRSPKRQKGFEEFQKFFNEEQNPKKILAPGQTRWLSLQNCVRRILEYWEALKHYWQLITFEDKTHANELTYSTLKNPLMKCMMEFVEYALGLFNDFNTFFQSDAPNFSNLKTEVTRLLKTLGLNFMDPKYIRNTEGLLIDPHASGYYLPLKSIYLGVMATETLNELCDAEEKEVEKIYKSVKDFYIESMVQIKKRFEFVTDDHFDDAQFLIPQNAKNLQPISLQPVAKKYLIHRTELNFNISRLDSHWREHIFLENTADDLHEYWKGIFKVKEGSKLKYEELSKCVSLFLALPFSNAVTERLFSSLKIVKSDKRNRLNDETLSSLLCVKHGMKRTKQDTMYLMENNVLGKKYVKSNACATSSKQIRLSSSGLVD
ncbi:hypothetical protein JTE90_011564 [Oedothorax gibbosus]|uniref:HAT C-terminal dimerisation domain-containing protein n=1 Tax=Oedothorax gibbosus TaxID=931172 RepID=A0AAV6UMA0_9ARAC|nr:hypothetical protein JTE90_011564 [Oedothorax gibbosus]